MGTKRRKRQNMVLFYGPWPDPRTGGLCCAAHEMVRGAVRDGWDALLITPAGESPLAKKSLLAALIPGDRPYDWREFVENFLTFRSLRHLVWADRYGVFEGVPDRLANVRIIHNHLDELPGGGYDFLASHIEVRAGRRPRSLRTLHVEISEQIDILMRLSGTDYVALPDDDKRRILDGTTCLEAAADRHVAGSRAELRAEGWEDSELDRPGSIVNGVVEQLRRWRSEIGEVDAFVGTTRRAAHDSERFLLPDEPAHVTFANIGTSFRPRNPARSARFLRDHLSHGVLGHRGADRHRERVPVGPALKRVLFVGRPVRSKGIYELVQALGILYRQLHQNVIGLFVGNFDERLRDQLTTHDPEHAREYLLFTGHVRNVDELASLYRLANVTALVSHFDPSPLVGMESYLMGTPCVVTEGISAAEIYLDRPAAEGLRIALPVARPAHSGTHMFHGVDVASLVCQLSTILQDEGLASRLAEEGRGYILRNHTGRHAWQGYRKLYEHLLGSHAGLRRHPR